jgi:hypothetical protein
MATKRIMAFEDNEVAEISITELQANEQQAAALVSIATDPEFQQLEQSDHTTEVIGQEIAAVAQTSTALEAMADALHRASSEGQMGVHGVRFANLAIESLTSGSEGRSARLAISVEAYRQDPKAALKAAMEDVQAQSDGLWATIKAKLGAMAQALSEKFKFFKNNIAKLEQRLHGVDSVVKGMDGEVRCPFLKPQDWFLDLCYLGKAAPIGLEGIGKSVEKLLTESTNLLSQSSKRYIQWLGSNRDKALIEPAVYNNLKFKKNDFLIQNQKEFSQDRKLVLHKASEGCAFYRGDELPGGKSLFAHLCKTDESGAAAIDALGEVEYTLSPFEPASYNRMKLAITAAIALPIAAYVGAVGGSILGAFVGATIGGIAGAVATGTAGGVLTGATVTGVVGSYAGAAGGAYLVAKDAAHKVLDYSKEKDADGNAYGKNAAIDKDMVFYTLTKSNATSVLSDVKSGIQAMHRMEQVMFKEVWADKTFIRQMDDIIEGTEASGQSDRVSIRLLKNLCFAIFNLQVSFSSNVVAYALRTYNSMLNYVEKSALQYRSA